MTLEPTYLIYGAVFIGMLLLVEGIYYLLVDMRRSGQYSPNRRLRMLAAGDSREDVMVRLQRERRAPSAAGLGDPIGWFVMLLVQSGLRQPPRRIGFLMLGIAGVALIATFAATRAPLVALPVAVVLGVVLPVLVLLIVRSRRLKRFTRQLPDAIDVMTRSLRAGHPVPTALGLVARELADPIGTEFGLVVDEMTYGFDLEQALVNMARRVQLPDVQFMVVAVMIQLQVGGNLAEVLTNLSRVIRERFIMRAKIRALSAEGRFSAVVLSILPFGLMLVINVVRPTYYTAVANDPAFWPILGTRSEERRVGKECRL